jgi:hypothetical protein
MDSHAAVASAPGAWGRPSEAGEGRSRQASCACEHGRLHSPRLCAHGRRRAKGHSGRAGAPLLAVTWASLVGGSKTRGGFVSLFHGPVEYDTPTITAFSLAGRLETIPRPTVACTPSVVWGGWRGGASPRRAPRLHPPEHDLSQRLRRGLRGWEQCSHGFWGGPDWLRGLTRVGVFTLRKLACRPASSRGFGKRKGLAAPKRVTAAHCRHSGVWMAGSAHAPWSRALEAHRPSLMVWASATPEESMHWPSC